MIDEHRKFPRISDNTNLACKLLDDDSPAVVDGSLATNISGGGICFQSPEAYEVGVRLALELELPGFPSAVIAIARVAWCEPAPDEGAGFEVGAEFHWIGWDSSAAQERIAEYIRAKLAS